MSTAHVVALIVAICLVPIGGLLACVDSALARVSKARAEEFLREERRGARALSVIMADRPRYTNLLLLLRLSCELTATVLATIVARAQFGARWPVALLTVLIMIVICYAIIGVGPRTLGRQHVNAVALAGAGTVRVLGGLFNPLAALLTLFGNAITPGKGLKDGPFASEVEIRELVDMAEERGVVEHDERQMIQSVFELGKTIAREVMVPRTEIVFIERTKTIPQGMALALRSGFSRIPVIGENVDDVVGVIYLKDLVRRSQNSTDRNGTKSSGPKVEELMRPPTFVPESKPVDELLRDMQAQRIHIAIVVDEYGGFAGLVTIEDILEEIVGEIADEHDRFQRPPVEELPDGSMRVTALLPVQDLAEVFPGVEVPEDDDVETVGGLLARALGRVPIEGSAAEVAGLRLVAESTGGRRNRIDTLLICRVPEEQDGEAAAEPARAEEPAAAVES